MATMTRAAYAAMYGPTKGDRIRLGNTSLMAEVEVDYATPGEELTTGGGKPFRDSLGVRARNSHDAGGAQVPRSLPS